ncbi:M16 family metallopeptidase [Paraliomyxa miuraensis]|uniref:M16 family metallopeptidase n=1 Tax=Paraliomyxa miuraensis TaxID=376150 RepID=UPI00224EFEC8|nr:M16 family metallopeptidase [Paraliomyxa miuraensis]MCX4242676.1 insulinase family protein [Paraliomyxa miuraensis]
MAARWSLLPLALLLAAPVAAASSCTRNLASRTDQPELPQPDRNLQFPDQGFLKEFDNGLKLFVVPDPYTRLIQFDVRHQVGSREDPQGKAGMAHFVEHLMFQMPIDGPGSTRLMLDLPQHSLTFNAYTAPDQTHYMHTGTSDELERYVKYTALRLGYDCNAVPETEFLRERDVVRNEHRWRGTGLGAFVYSRMLEQVFPEGHPYRRSLVDIDADLVSITPDDACKFIRRWYTPGQATVVVSGDVDPLEVLELAKKYLEPLPKVAVPARPAVPPIEIAGVTKEIKAPVKKATAAILFEMPKRFSRDDAAASAAQEMLFLAVNVLTSLDESTSSVIESIVPTGFGGEEAFVFGVAIETKKARDLDRGIDAVLDAIHRGFEADVTKDDIVEYQVARQRARLQVLSSISNILGRSGTYADYLEEGQNPGFYGAELAEIDKLTDVQAQEVGRRLFAREKAMVVKVVPDGSTDTPTAERAKFDYKPEDEEKLALPEDIDPAEAHKPLELTDIAPPEAQYVEYELDNGMQVVLVQSSQVPVMDVQIIIGAGTVDGSRPELAEAAQRLYGFRDDLEARNLSSFFQAAGGIWGGDVGAQSTTYYSRGLAIYLDFLVAGVSEQVVQAQYRTGALDSWKLGVAKRLEKQNTVQRIERENAFYTALYGQGHPHVRAQISDRGKLKEITLRDVEGFRDTHYRAGNSAIIITGGYDMQLAIQYVERFFGKPTLRDRRMTWLEPKATAERAPVPEPKPGTIRVMTEADKERVQTDLRIGFPLAEVYGDEHAALLVLSNMLNEEVAAVRQKLGASYGVYAGLSTERPNISIGGALDSTKAGVGTEAILAAIQSIRDGEDFDRRFAFARRAVLKDMLNAQADSELLAGRLADAVRNGRSYDYFQELARAVATLEPKTVKAQIDKVLVPSRSVILVQGPAEGIQNVVTHNKMTVDLKLPDVIHDEDDD